MTDEDEELYLRWFEYGEYVEYPWSVVDARNSTKVED